MKCPVLSLVRGLKMLRKVQVSFSHRLFKRKINCTAFDSPCTSCSC